MRLWSTSAGPWSSTRRAVELPSIYVHLGACQKDLGYFKEAAESLTRALAELAE